MYVPPIYTLKRVPVAHISCFALEGQGEHSRQVYFYLLDWAECQGHAQGEGMHRFFSAEIHAI